MPARRKPRKPMTAAAKKRAQAKRRATMRRNGTAAGGKRRATASRRKRKCPLSSAVMEDGMCKPLPCLDAEGHPVPFSVRGKDGECRIKTCGPGMIMSHKTGKCVSSKTPDGRLMYLAKKYDDAKRFTNSYEQASGEGPVERYYGRFNASDFTEARRQEREDMRADLKQRADSARALRDQKQRTAQRNSSFFSSFRNNMQNGNGRADGLGGRRSGGSSFSFF